MRAYVLWSNALLDDAAIRRDLFVESPLVHPSVMARTATLRGLGGYRDYDGPEDYDLWLRAAAAGLRFSKLPEVLLQWRDSSGRLTRRDPRYAPERFFARKLAALLEGPLSAGRPVVVWGAGEIGKSLGSRPPRREVSSCAPSWRWTRGSSANASTARPSSGWGRPLGSTPPFTWPRSDSRGPARASGKKRDGEELAASS